MFYPVVTSQTPIKCWIMVVFLAVVADDVARSGAVRRGTAALCRVEVAGAAVVGDAVAGAAVDGGAVAGASDVGRAVVGTAVAGAAGTGSAVAGAAVNAVGVAGVADAGGFSGSYSTTAPTAATTSAYDGESRS
jgi:hypothetical protein